MGDFHYETEVWYHAVTSIYDSSPKKVVDSRRDCKAVGNVICQGNWSGAPTYIGKKILEEMFGQKEGYNLYVCESPPLRR